MNEKKWEKFFDLLNDIVDMPNKSVKEKVEAVKEAASEYGESAEMNLEEFTAWDFEA